MRYLLSRIRTKVMRLISEQDLAMAYRDGKKTLVDFRRIFHPSRKESSPANFHYEWSRILLDDDSNFAIEAFRESAKALALDTEIPTPNGFKTVGEMAVGDELYDDYGEICQVKSLTPIFNERKCYRLTFDDKTSVVADAGHLWWVLDKHQRKFRTLTSEHIHKNLKLGAVKNGYQEYAFRVPTCEAVENKEKELPIPPYLMGAWLGDGHTNGAMITVGKEHHEYAEHLVSLWGNGTISEYETSYVVNLNGKFRAGLVSAGVLGNKHIPVDYLNASFEQRMALLCGLVDTDGTVAKDGTKIGTVSITTNSPRLADDYLVLVRSLGIKATINKSTAKIYGRDCGLAYKVNFKTTLPVATIGYKKDRLQDKQDKRSMMRTIVSVEEVDSVPVRCIEVTSPTHLFLITKSFIPTHNSTYIDKEFPLYCLTYPSWTRCFIVFILHDQTAASNKLQEVVQEYLADPILSSNVVQIRENNSRAFDVLVKDMEGNEIPVRLMAFGKGAAIRGLVHRDQRPSMIIIDDPQDEEDSRSDIVLQNDWNWFLSDIKFMGQYCRIFIIGNNLGEKCLIERIIANAKNLEFKTQIIPVMEDNKPTWPAKYTLEEIEKERDDFIQMGEIDVWFRNKMCVAMSPDSQIFKKPYFKYYRKADIKRDNCSRYTTVDLAISEKDTADRTWVITAFVNSDNNWFIWKATRGRLNPTQTMDAIFDHVSQYKPQKVGIENVAYQASLQHFITREMPKRNIFFAIEPLKAQQRKRTRIEALQPRFHAGTIWFPEDAEDAEWVKDLELELLGFPRAKHDDGPDALAYFPQIVVPPVRANMNVENTIAGSM